MLFADFPGFLRKGALEAPGRQLEVPRDISTLRKHGAGSRLRLVRMGRKFRSAVDFGAGPPRKPKGAVVSASRFEWAVASKRPNLPGGGLRLPNAEDGLYQFVPPFTSSVS